jgi:nitroreductase
VTVRRANFAINSIFLERWSPRAFMDEDISEAELMVMFEAARWAPSGFNIQPWRFLYARRGTSHWPIYVGLLNEFNAQWASRASALIVVISDGFVYNPATRQSARSPSHSFDAGAAWACLALQSTWLGWHAHAMSGIHVDRIRSELNVPEHFRVESAIAIGRAGDKEMLPERLQSKERPGGRRDCTEMVFEGCYVPTPRDTERLLGVSTQ